MKRFRLIALLIVLVVVNLGGAHIIPGDNHTGMHTAMGEAIAETLQDLRAAALTYLANGVRSPDEFPDPAPRANNIGRIVDYMKYPRPKCRPSDIFAFYAEGDALWVGYIVENYRIPTLKWLQDKAETVGLFGTSNLSIPPVSDDKAGLYKKENPVIWMRIK